MPLHECAHPGCAYTSQKKVLMTLHLRTHTKELPFACEHAGCGYRARQRAHLSVHMVTHSEERPYACTEAGCAYAAKTRSLLKVHAKAVHGGEGQGAQCPHCDFRTGLPRMLQEHINAHLGIKPYQCQLCGLTTTYRTHFFSHSKRCKGPAGSRRLLRPALAAAERAKEEGQAEEELDPLAEAEEAV